MLAYKIDVLKALKEAGYNTTRLRKEKLISESQIQSIRENNMIGIKTLDKICFLLDSQPGEIIKFVSDNQ